ncbi:filaggrin-2-like [Anopheles albimanus]|uniref:Uncharacterized protein n=1 Tax=Anopheles albimanus TaxID=7167 RepID=A0A182FKH8_ANOAL|nr:filaggrin-2-like [Anopheles albimanus]
MKVFIIVAVSVACMAGSSQGASAKSESKGVEKRGIWGFGNFYSGFGDSLARSDGGHQVGGHGGFGEGLEGHQFASGGWEHQLQQQQQDHFQPQSGHEWSQEEAFHGGQEFKSHPVHEWQAEQGHGQIHGSFEHPVPQVHQYGGSFGQQQSHQAKSLPTFHFQQNIQHDSVSAWPQQHQQQHGFGSQEISHGSSGSWHQDEAKESTGAAEGSHGSEWAPIAGGSHELKELSHESKGEQESHHGWSSSSSIGEGKEHHEEGDDKGHHHTKIIKVPYPVHIEKPYPVYIEKPFIVEKPVPLKLYIKKKSHH